MVGVENAGGGVEVFGSEDGRALMVRGDGKREGRSGRAKRKGSSWQKRGKKGSWSEVKREELSPGRQRKKGN